MAASFAVVITNVCFWSVICSQKVSHILDLRPASVQAGMAAGLRDLHPGGETSLFQQQKHGLATPHNIEQ